MKLIVLTAAALMAGAGIYGFARYQNTSRQKAFQDLYRETQAAPALPAEPAIDPKAAPIAVAEKPAMQSGNEKQKKQLNRKTKKRLDLKIFSRAPLREEVVKLSVPAPKKAAAKQ